MVCVSKGRVMVPFAERMMLIRRTKKKVAYYYSAVFFQRAPLFICMRASFFWNKCTSLGSNHLCCQTSLIVHRHVPGGVSDMSD